MTSTGQYNPNCSFWFQFLDANNGMPATEKVIILEEVLTLNSTWSRALAEAKDKGRRGYDITDPECKAVFRKHMYLCGRYQLKAGVPIHISATAVVMYANDHQLVEEYKKSFLSNLSEGMDGLDFDGFKEALSELCVMLDVSDFTSNAENMASSYSLWDKNNNDTISEAEFEEFCIHTFGSSREIVMKFMKNQVT